jgi:hypothetical protein
VGDLDAGRASAVCDPQHRAPSFQRGYRRIGATRAKESDDVPAIWPSDRLIYNADMRPQPESTSGEVLAGLVERVTYHNPENGFCVLRAKVRGHRDVVTVVGHAATIAAGEWITAPGEWVNDRTLSVAAAASRDQMGRRPRYHQTRMGRLTGETAQSGLQALGRMRPKGVSAQVSSRR